MPASIFNGTAVKVLKDLLRFKSGKEIVTNVTDANIIAGVVAPVGSYAISNEGRGYHKYGAGDTDWNPEILSIGVPGGQSIQGGNAANENLSLESTSHATKGRILAKDPINFDVAAASPTYAAGNASWNPTERTLDIQTGLGNTTLQVGHEFFIYVKNNTGLQVDNGLPVYIDSIDAGVPTIALANAKTTFMSKCEGIATMDIPDGQFGIITRLGLVRDIDTSGLTPGPAYLTTTDGVLSSSKPNDGAFVSLVGGVLVSDAVNGLMYVDPTSSELTVEVTDTNGFPVDQRAATTLSTSDGLRQFTVASGGLGFHFYELGFKYEKDGNTNDVSWANVEGIHAFYFEQGVLKSLANPTPAQFNDIVLKFAFVAYIYWDATNSSSLNFIGEERHGIGMSPQTHLYLHLTRGAQYVSGLGLADFVIGNGSLNTHVQFSSAAGTFFDEDIDNNPVAIPSTVGFPIYYLSGASANLRRILEPGYSALTDTTAGVGATGQLVWNEFTGGAWQLTTVGSNNFVLYHIFATNGYPGKDQLISIVGQADYATANLARSGAETEISNLLLVLPQKELVPVGTIIYQVNSGYANALKAKIILTGDGEDYIDWRTTELTQGAAPTNHNNLAGLELAQDTITWGHINDQTQVLKGQKDFTDGIKLANSTVTADNILDEDAMTSDSATALCTQQSIKKYVDDSGGWTLNGTGIIDPTVTDDSSDGYSINSLFTNTVTLKSFICQRATVGSAIWASFANGINPDIPDAEAFWDFTDGDITNDDSGNGITLTNLNSVTSDSTGATFTGSGDATTSETSLYESGTFLDNVTSWDIAVEMYFNISSLPITEAEMFYKSNISLDNYMILQLTSAATLRLATRTGGGTVNAVVSSTLSTGVWYHALAIWSVNDGVALYIDNASVGTPIPGATTMMATGSGTGLNIGADPTGEAYGFNGTIKYGRVFNHVMTSVDRTAVYNSRLY